MSFDSSISLVGQRAVAQLGRASEPTTRVIGGDAVDAYQRWAPSQPTKRTDTGVSQESEGKPLARRIQILPARPFTSVKESEFDVHHRKSYDISLWRSSSLWAGFVSEPVSLSPCSPLATIAVTSPILLVIMAALVALYGIVGGLRGKNQVQPKDMRSW